VTLNAKWKQTVDDGVSNKQWDEYDSLIQSEVKDYNRRLAATPHFKMLDWKVFKAIVWAESCGPATAAWTMRPMQIGNLKDKGYPCLRNGEETAPLIMSDKLKEDIKGDINQPQLNIRAGIAYALVRLTTSAIKSVDDPKDTTIYEHVVEKGASFDRIAPQVDTTVASLQKLNPTAKVLKIGQKIKYRKASMQRVITGWRALTTANLATRYNVGDPHYMEKLDYVLSLFPKLQR
jgi:LysM repeat protein